MTLKIKPGLDWVPQLLRRLLTGWILAVTLEYLFLPVQLRDLSSLTGLAEMDPLRVIVMTLAVAGLLWCASLIWNTDSAERWMIFGLFALLSGACLWVSFSWGLLGACVLMWILLAVYAIGGWQSEEPAIAEPRKGHWIWLVATALMAGVFFLFVSVWTVCRYRSFCAPSFDFGIFAQMFHNMKETGLPMTTLERDGPLSHFRVHMSPIYYLMLPFYCIYPDPATLQVLQAAVLASAVIPMWLIGKHHGLSAPVRTLLCAVLLLYPALSGGTSYDIHENCFLTPLILWLLYGIDRKNSVLTGIAAALTLMVKEDAAVYVAVIALWLLLRTVLRCRRKDLKDLITGGVLLAGSLIWFFLVTGYLAKNGDGVMTYSYGNFMFDGSDSLLTVVWAVILCPMKAVYECVDPEKLTYIARTMLPLLGLPLLTRRFERYILLIPYLLVNLMSDYQYQHDILFQYSFGSAACLLYLTAVNVAALKPEWPRLAALAAAAAVSVGFFISAILPVAKTYPQYCRQYAGYYENVRNTLAQIPEDASVSATTFYTAYLSQRETLYDIRYASWEHVRQTEYVVLKLNATDYTKYATGGQNNGYQNLLLMLQGEGYELWEELDGVLAIYKKPAA